MSREFADAMVELYECGALEGAVVFMFCAHCDDITEAWDLDRDVCAHCGFCIPDRLPRGKSKSTN